MRSYLIGVMVIGGVVDLLLLLSISRLWGSPVKPAALLGAAVLGGVYAAWCLVPGFHFLGNVFWRLIFLALKGILAFGPAKPGIAPCVLFMLASLALSGFVGIAGNGSPLLFAAGGILIAAMCFISLRGKPAGGCVPVELRYGEKHLRLTALCDTGNNLRDPITGRSVLVIGAESARQLTGLTKEQLQKPLETIGTLPGLRLIPYRTIGQAGGFLLALQIPKVRIGTWQGSTLVALAPEGVGTENTYQALTGGSASWAHS